LSFEEAVPAYSLFYPEQQLFPPKKKEMFYDVEGFLNLYNFIFTKNRSKG
jgi:hypothetical protein